jgi:dipeptide transport system ATP-binding protein
MNLLEVQNLNIEFKSESQESKIHAIKNLSFNIAPGEMLGVVGESGSGKSITNLAIMDLLGSNAIVTADKCLYKNELELINIPDRSVSMKKIRGREIAMIFQDPMTALNPFLSVEFQIVETILAHTDLTKNDAKNKAIELLTTVGIPSPKDRLKAYPFELSGGMAQRVMIAMSLSSSPSLLIADEPTTALDVTIQKQILSLLKQLQEKQNMAIVLVTHDLGLVSEYSDRIQVMYAGEMVESGTTQELLTKPTHPYTEALLQSRPSTKLNAKTPLPTIPGIVPSFLERPNGCQFHPRCQYADAKCAERSIEIQKTNNQMVRCLYPLGRQL